MLPDWSATRRSTEKPGVLVGDNPSDGLRVTLQIGQCGGFCVDAAETRVCAGVALRPQERLGRYRTYNGIVLEP